MKHAIARYLKEHNGWITDEMAYMLSALSLMDEVSPLSAQAVIKELESQRSSLKLIASENYSSLSVQAAMGTLFTDKYSEGYPFHRFYAGCENVAENHASEQVAV